MLRFKKMMLSPYMFVFWIGVFLPVAMVTFYQRHQRSQDVEYNNVSNVQSDAKRTSGVSQQKTHQESSHHTEASEHTQSSPISVEVANDVNNPVSVEQVSMPSLAKDVAQRKSTSTPSRTDKSQQGISDEVKKDPRDANLDELMDVVEQELFKDIDPTSDIHIMTSENDTMKLINRLESKPNRSEALQNYIDIIKKSLEEPSEKKRVGK